MRFLMIVLTLMGVTTQCSIWALYPPPPPVSHEVRLDDLNGDGNPDAVIANGPGNIDYAGEANLILLGDGLGHLEDGGQLLIGSQRSGLDVSHTAALGDLDDDGDLDIIFGNAVQSPNSIWLNDGTGHFKLRGELTMKVYQEFGYVMSKALALGDLDGDGDLDVYVGNCCRSQYGGMSRTGTFSGFANAENMVWLNDGTGHFTDSGQRLDNQATSAVALGDLDGDGDLDVFEVNQGGTLSQAGVPGGQVRFNDGSGQFSDSQQLIGHSTGLAVALGDLDGDGDLDAFIGNGQQNRADSVWLNDGSGQFRPGNQSLGDEDTRLVVLSDVDQDGDLDAFTGYSQYGRFWANDGAGQFTANKQRFIWKSSSATNLADLDRDGDVDILTTTYNGQYRIWWNDGRGHFRKDGNQVVWWYLIGFAALAGLILLLWRLKYRSRHI